MIRVQLRDTFTKKCSRNIHQCEAKPLGEKREFEVHIAAHSSFTHQWMFCYRQYQVDAAGHQVERDIITLIGHLIKRQHHLHVELVVTSARDVTLEVPVFVIPSQSEILLAE